MQCLDSPGSGRGFTSSWLPGDLLHPLATCEGAQVSSTGGQSSLQLLCAAGFRAGATMKLLEVCPGPFPRPAPNLVCGPD